MRKALQDAFAAASRLSDEEQDSLAAAILEEVAVDERWDASFAGSHAALERLADEALAEEGGGRALPLDPSKL